MADIDSTNKKGPEAKSKTELWDPKNPPVVPGVYLLPFILTTCCFALWGFANDFTNPLVKVYELVFNISVGEASTLQFAFYTGYFCMAIPAALFIRIFSYKAAIIVGFAFYAIGALMAIPASMQATFGLFLLGSYILTYGLAFLETACNPYILAMGPRETATQRLNLAQAFNPVGSLCGMIVASQFVAPYLLVTEFQENMRDKDASVVKYIIEDEKQIPEGAKLETSDDGKSVSVILPDERKSKVTLYKKGLPNFDTQRGALGTATKDALRVFQHTEPEEFDKFQKTDLANVRTPYIVIAAIVLVFLAMFALAKMPLFKAEEKPAPFLHTCAHIFCNPRFVGGVIAQTFYVGAQIMCWTFIVHYGMDEVGLTISQAQNWNIVAMVLFLTCRWICTFLLRYIRASHLLFVFSIGAMLATVGAILLKGETFELTLFGNEMAGNLGLMCLVAVSGFMSLMFPTIYGIALGGMEEEESKLGSAFLIMAIVGGAFLTKIQGMLVDAYDARSSFWLPFGCFVIIALFSLVVAMLPPQSVGAKTTA